MSKLINKLTALILAAVCLTAAAAGCAANKEPPSTASAQTDTTEGNSTMEYTDYIKELGIDLAGMTADEDGEITSGGEYAYICFTLVDGKRTEVEDLLNEVCGRMREVSPETIPGYQNHRLAEKMKAETFIGKWKMGISGKNGQKSRILTFYMTEQNGISYLYFFG